MRDTNRNMSERIIDRFMRKSEQDQLKRTSEMSLDF